VLGAGQSAVIADVSEDTAFPIDERMRILGGRPARLGASRRRSPAKAQRPPVGGGTDRQHGWQTTDPLCWRYAGCEILAILAQFRELRLGSGPRNRVHRTSSRTFTTSGSSEAWYRARFGTERSRVRIPPSRPLTHGFTEPGAVESAAGQPEIRPK
jgi:hypothetical protein